MAVLIGVLRFCHFVVFLGHLFSSTSYYVWYFSSELRRLDCRMARSCGTTMAVVTGVEFRVWSTDGDEVLIFLHGPFCRKK